MRLPLFLMLLLSICALGAQATSASQSPDVVQDPHDPFTYTFATPFDTVGMNHHWSFGDGTTSTEETPTHTYLRPGRYAVRVALDGGPTEQEPLVTTVVAGPILLFQDFETSPPAGWTYDPERLSSLNPIQGSVDWTASIIAPATSDSCVPPQHLPHNPKDKSFPLLGTDIYEGLINLRPATIPDGGVFTFFWMDDPDSDDVVFEARIRGHQGGLQIGLVVADANDISQQWIDLPALNVRFEIHPWRATDVVPDGGGGHLRILDPVSSEQLATVSLTGLSNMDAPWLNPTFGISRSSFPPAATGKFRLDELAVRAYNCEPPAEIDLLGAWSFEDPADLGFDSSGQGRHGTVFGGATASNGTLALDGTGHIEIPSLNASLVDRKQLTAEAWVYVHHHTQTNIFRSQQPFTLSSDRLAVSNYSEGSGWELAVAGSAPPLGDWYHVAGVFNQGVMSLYVNGVLSSEKIVPWSVTGGTSYATWAIGARTPGGSGTDQFFTGYLDNVRLYSRALSVPEVKAAALLCGH